MKSQGSEQVLERSAYSILCLLHDQGPLRPGTLACHFRVYASTISRQIASLESSGLILRVTEADDRRACRLRLTESGEQSLVATRNARRRMVRGVLGSWPTDRQELFAELLTDFNQALHDPAAAAAVADPPPVTGEDLRKVTSPA